MRPPPISASASGETGGTVLLPSFVLWFMALDSFLRFTRSSPIGFRSIMVGDGNPFHQPFGFRPRQIDFQQAVLQVRPQNFHPFREHEGALELARRDAAVEVVPAFVILLPAADDELIFLNGN